MAYNFFDFLEKTDTNNKNVNNIDEWKVDIASSVKVFSREFYNIGSIPVCKLSDFLNSCQFEVFQNDEGTISIRYDDKNLGYKKWLQDFKIIFNLKNNLDIHNVKDGVLISAEKCVDILRKLISSNQSIVDNLKKLCIKYKGNEKEKTYDFLMRQEQKSLDARKKLLDFIINKINNIKLKESENDSVCSEIINEDNIRTKGFEVEIIYFNNANVKCAVKLSDMLDRLGFPKSISEYPLIWLKRGTSFNVRLGDNVYVEPLTGIVWVDVNLALDILSYVETSPKLGEYSARKIEHMKLFLKKHFSTNNPRKILENEAPTNAFLELERELKQISY